MDVRSWLGKDTWLPFPGMPCRITSCVGKGSNALVYLGEYEDAGLAGQFHEVLIKELFPLHPQGAIYRDDDGKICVTSEGLSLYRLHKSSFERGNRIHLDLLKKSPSMIGANVNTFSHNATLYTVMGCSGGVPFEAAMQAQEHTLRGIAQRMLAVLDALEVFHGAGLLHLDISPGNILLIPQAQREHVILIDYNSSATCEEIQSGTMLYSSVKQGYTAPEVSTGDFSNVGFPSDLYSVAAVFFTCLMGRCLTLEETIRSAPPDGQGSRYVADAPDTVRYMVKRILRRGLHTLLSRRYADIAAMRVDFQELLDRIDGVGVTHGALYESARSALNRFVRKNPSFSFLNRDMYPMHFSDEALKKRMDTDALLKMCLSGGSPVGLEANGGQGKTTALLDMAARQNASYSPQKAVAVFLAAYGYRAEESWFIHDSILRLLRFKRETETYDAARHELDGLFSRTTGAASGPSVLILLDGLNEIACDTASLFRELNELAQMPGVALLLSSRGEVQGLPVRRVTLEPLSDAEAAEALTRHGLLVPEDARMRQLVRTPLMLSLFIRASAAAKQQLRVATVDELMRSLFRMEVERFAQEEPVYWQMDAAIHYVLPAIAGREQALHRALTQRELLSVLTRCYRTIRARDMLRFYPQWIGHSKAILGGARNAEEWLSGIVLDLLWRRTGLLVRDEDGGYRVFHQEIKQWLLGVYQRNRSRILKRKLCRIGAVSIAALALGGFGWVAVWKPYIQPVIEQAAVRYYPKEEAKEVVRASLERCYMGRTAVESVLPFLEYAGEGAVEYFDLYLPATLRSFEAWTFTGGNALKQRYAAFESSVEQGRMPWSGNDFSAQEFSELADFPNDMASQYGELLKVLDWMMRDEKWYGYYSQEYISTFRELVQADLELIHLYYARLLKPEVDAMEKADRAWYRELKGRYGEFEAPQQEASLDSLLEKRNTLLRRLNNGAAMDRYQQEQQ